VRDYYLEVSYNSLTINSSHYPDSPNPSTTNASYQDSNPREYFQPYDAVTNPIGYRPDQRAAREHQLLADAVNWINQNSPVPTNLEIDADNDGHVDCVSFIFKGSPDGWGSMLWAHRWSLTSQTVNINGSRVYGYTFEPENTSRTTYCHEIFHVLGAPDLYHYSADYGHLAPVSRWDLMESGSGHMGAYMKWQYSGNNWISSIPEITSSGTYTLNPITASSNNCFRIASPNSTNEFFVVEYRREMGTYESNIPGSGMLVYRINTDFRGNADFNNSTVFDEVYIYRPDGTTSENGSPRPLSNMNLYMLMGQKKPSAGI
jgi:M6 family metalloprotease-like protein